MGQTITGRDPRDDEEYPEPPRLRALRRMATALMAVLGLGMLTIAGVMVWRLGFDPAPLAPSAATPAEIALPAGETVLATGGDGAAVILATRDAAGAEWLVYFDRETGAETARTRLRRTAD